MSTCGAAAAIEACVEANINNTQNQPLTCGILGHFQGGRTSTEPRASERPSLRLLGQKFEIVYYSRALLVVLGKCINTPILEKYVYIQCTTVVYSIVYTV